MLFLGFTTVNVDNLEACMKAADKIGKNPPEGYRLLEMYSCQANPFDGTPLKQGEMVSVSLVECDSAEALAAANLEMTMAGAKINRIPVMKMSAGGVEDKVDEIKIS